MENNERKLLRLRDVFIIVSIIAAVFVFYALLPESGGETAVVSHNGGVIAEIPLDGAGEYVFPQVPDMGDNGGLSPAFGEKRIKDKYRRDHRYYYKNVP